LVPSTVHYLVGAGLVPVLPPGGHRALPYLYVGWRSFAALRMTWGRAQDDRGVGGHGALPYIVT